MVRGTGSGHEAKGIALFKNVEAETVGDGKAASADRSDGTPAATTHPDFPAPITCIL
jgi:hypothetical protein